jgi:hypothetical protein
VAAEGEPIKIVRAENKLVYFDTSSWNDLAKHRDPEHLVQLIQRSNIRVLASVISVGEVLRTPTEDLRQKTCLVMRTLHGDGPLLERSFNELAHAAARGVLQGQEDFPLPETGPGKYLRACMSDATQPPPTDEIWGWLCNMRDQMELFIQEIKPPQRDLTMCYLSPEVIFREDFLKCLCQFPPAQELGLSVPQMRSICEKSDVWKALGATLAYIIGISTTHAPKNIKGPRRPGAEDLWQAPYLGVVEIFVTSDGPMLEAISRISTLLPHPRRVVCTEEFLEPLTGK